MLKSRVKKFYINVLRKQLKNLKMLTLMKDRIAPSKLDIVQLEHIIYFLHMQIIIHLLILCLLWILKLYKA